MFISYNPYHSVFQLTLNFFYHAVEFIVLLMHFERTALFTLWNVFRKNFHKKYISWKNCFYHLIKHSSLYIPGACLGGALGARAPRCQKRGAKKKEKRKGKERERGERGKKRKRREKERKQRKKEGAKKEKERSKVKSTWREGAMQLQVQAGAPGKKTSGALNWQRKGREGRHAVQVQAGAPGK